MADNHYVFNRNIAAGLRLGRGMEDLDNAITRLRAEKDTMTQMLDGDGSAVGHYAAHVTAYGFSDTTNAKAAYDELNALLAKIDSDAAVSSVKTAIAQASARFRN